MREASYYLTVKWLHYWLFGFFNTGKVNILSARIVFGLFLIKSSNPETETSIVCAVFLKLQSYLKVNHGIVGRSAWA